MNSALRLSDAQHTIREVMEGETMLEQFCSFLQEQGKSENTVKSYRLAVDGYMKWYGEIGRAHV